MIKDKIKQLRLAKGYTQNDLANLIGVSSGAISMYERGEREPSIETLHALSKIFKVDMNYLLGLGAPIITSISKASGKVSHDDAADKNVVMELSPLQRSFLEEKGIYKKKGVPIPLLGSVAAGIPIEAITDIEDYEEISEEMAATGDFAALKIKGDSMEPRFTEGDVVIVKLQDTVETGDIAIVLVNGDEATCKKIKKTPEGVMLISTNPKYEPMFYSNREIEEKPVRIWGKVVELRAKF